MSKRQTPKNRAGWTYPVQDDPMYPFPPPMFPPDTTSIPKPPMGSKRVTWGRIKSRFRRGDEGE